MLVGLPLTLHLAPLRIDNKQDLPARRVAVLRIPRDGNVKRQRRKWTSRAAGEFPLCEGPSKSQDSRDDVALSCVQSLQCVLSVRHGPCNGSHIRSGAVEAAECACLPARLPASHTESPRIYAAAASADARLCGPSAGHSSVWHLLKPGGTLSHRAPTTLKQPLPSQKIR